MAEEIVILGVGNVLEKDDGIGVYAATWLEANYTFDRPVKIVNGGVEGINLLNLFMESEEIIILDTLLLDDGPGSIYNIPAEKLEGMGLNSGGAHEIGVLQCLSMIELLGKEAPRSNVIGIVPASITFEIGLSETLSERFEPFVGVVLDDLRSRGITPMCSAQIRTLETIIEQAKDPSYTPSC